MTCQFKKFKKMLPPDVIEKIESKSKKLRHNLDKFESRNLEKLESNKNLSDYIEAIRKLRSGTDAPKIKDEVLYEFYGIIRENLHDSRISSKNKAITELYIINCYSYVDIAKLLGKRSSTIKEIVDKTIRVFVDEIFKYLDEE